MMTKLRRDRRTQRTAKFNLEALDDRIVPSAMGAEAAVAGHVHTHASERAMLIQQRHEMRIARHEARLAAREARHEARLARIEARHAAMMQSSAASPITMNPSVTASTAAHSPAARSHSATVPPATTMTFNPVLPFLTTNSGTPVSSISTGASTGSNSNVNSPGPLPPNVSAQLQSIYQQFQSFESSGGSGTFSPTGVKGVVISGTNVGINFHTNDTANFDAIMAQLQSDGLQVTSSSSTYGLIDGMLPIAQLPAVAQISSSASVTAMSYQTPMG